MVVVLRAAVPASLLWWAHALWLAGRLAAAQPAPPPATHHLGPCLQAEHFRGLLREALERAEQQQRQQLRRQAEQLTAAHAGGSGPGPQAGGQAGSQACCAGGDAACVAPPEPSALSGFERILRVLNSTLSNVRIPSAAEMTVHERLERSARLDALRERVNALEAALRQRRCARRPPPPAEGCCSAGWARSLARRMRSGAWQRSLVFAREGCACCTSGRAAHPQPLSPAGCPCFLSVRPSFSCLPSCCDARRKVLRRVARCVLAGPGPPRRAPPPPPACSDEQRTSHGAHQLSLAVAVLRSALAAGGPLGEALGMLQGLAERDAVVAAAVRAVRRRSPRPRGAAVCLQRRLARYGLRCGRMPVGGCSGGWAPGRVRHRRCRRGGGDLAQLAHTLQSGGGLVLLAHTAPLPLTPCPRLQVPAGAAAAPVPTRAQLSDRFVDVARLARQLSMLPEGQGGMLSLAVAKLAAALKAGLGGGGGVFLFGLSGHGARTVLPGRSDPVRCCRLRLPSCFAGGRCCGGQCPVAG